MDARQLLDRRRDDVLRAASARGARNVRLFGSLARGDADESSDIDLLVDMEPGRSLLDLGGLHADLEELLGCRADVVSERGLTARARETVLAEAVPL